MLVSDPVTVSRRDVTPVVTSETVTLGTRGRRLWADLTAAAEPSPAARVLIEEACRLADRLDRLDRILTGRDAEWLRLRVNDDGSEVTVTVDKVLSEARQQQVALKAVLGELRAMRTPAATAPPQGKGGGVADLSARLAARRAAGQ